MGEREEAVSAVVRSIADGADRRDWKTVGDAFAPRVVLDYGSPELLTPDQIVERWRPLFAQLTATKHRIDVDEVRFAEPDRAWTRSHFTARHLLVGAAGGDEWILTGRYEHELVRTPGGWKVDRMRMISGPATGNGDLLSLALKKAGVTPPAPGPYRVEHVAFDSEGTHLVGLLYLPTSNGAKTPEDSPSRLPAAIVTGSWTTVKEQMPSLYAQELASAGFAALTFDFRGFGESEGEPRAHEAPARKIADLHAAVGVLAGHPRIDSDRLALVAVCASAGYAAAEATNDNRIRSLVMIAPWLHDASLVEQVYGNRVLADSKEKGVPALIAAGEAAADQYHRERHVIYVPAASTTDTAAAMYIPDGKVLDYYLNPKRGGIPQWGNRFAVMSWPDWLRFNALASAPRLHTPTLIVHSPDGAIPDGARRFAAAMPQRPEIVWLSGTQFDFYDDAATVKRASREAIQHLRRTLASPSAPSVPSSASPPAATPSH